MKKCVLCLINEPRNSRSKYCLTCKEDIKKKKLEVYDKKYRSENKIKEYNRVKEYRLKNKKDHLEKSKAYRQKNKNIIAKRNKEYRKLHPEIYRVAASKRRHKKANIECTLTAKEWLEILQLFNNCCAYCLRSSVELTIDHMYPFVKHGNGNAENCIPSCMECNSSKSGGSMFYMLSHLNPRLNSKY